MLPVSSVLSSSTASSVSPATSRTRARIVLIVSSDSSLRERLCHSLSGLRWQVLEAPGGAEAWMATQATPQLEAMLIDPWLPDLDVPEFIEDFHRNHPHVDLMMTDGVGAQESPRSPYHQELLYALRRSQDGNSAAWNAAPAMTERMDERTDGRMEPSQLPQLPRLVVRSADSPAVSNSAASQSDSSAIHAVTPMHATEVTPFIAPVASRAKPGIPHREIPAVERIPELVGSSATMLEISRRIRLVAARSTPVLIEGPTG
jgi:DNA-binding NtrC family response regulator